MTYTYGPRQSHGCEPRQEHWGDRNSAENLAVDSVIGSLQPHRPGAGVLADLLARAGPTQAAITAFLDAASLTRNEKERALLRKRAQRNVAPPSTAGPVRKA